MINVALLILSYFFMEFVAWSNHKYVMHGFLWKWHKDHHVNDRKKLALDEMQFSGFEKNDYFFSHLCYSGHCINDYWFLECLFALCLYWYRN